MQYHLTSIPSEANASNRFPEKMKSSTKDGSRKIGEGKNKFINKLKRLHNEYPINHHQLHWRDPRQRNKLAARQSRDRKRTYIQLIERRIERDEAQLNLTLQQIKTSKQALFRLQMQQPRQVGQSDKHTHIIQKLQTLILDEGINERNNEINICVDSLIYRIGATGNERRQVLERLYHDILNFSLPALYRYFIWSAHKGVHLFNEIEPVPEDHWFQEMKIHLEKKNDQDLKQLRSLFQKQKNSLLGSSNKLMHVKEEIKKHGPSLDAIVNHLREILTPVQVTQLLLFIERHQYKDEMLQFLGQSTDII